jgi:hypothetical protein
MGCGFWVLVFLLMIGVCGVGFVCVVGFDEG